MNESIGPEGGNVPAYPAPSPGGDSKNITEDTQVDHAEKWETIYGGSSLLSSRAPYTDFAEGWGVGIGENMRG